MYNGVEQRRGDRFDADTLSVDIKYQDTGMTHQRSDRANTIDFNRFGIAIESRLSLDVHDEIILKCTHCKKRISDLVGFICNKNSYKGTCRYGILFDFSANDFMNSREVKSTLENFEHFLAGEDTYNDVQLNRNAYRRIKKQTR